MPSKANLVLVLCLFGPLLHPAAGIFAGVMPEVGPIAAAEPGSPFNQTMAVLKALLSPLQQRLLGSQNNSDPQQQDLDRGTGTCPMQQAFAPDAPQLPVDIAPAAATAALAAVSSSTTSSGTATEATSTAVATNLDTTDTTAGDTMAASAIAVDPAAIGSAATGTTAAFDLSTPSQPTAQPSQGGSQGPMLLPAPGVSAAAVKGPQLSQQLAVSLQLSHRTPPGHGWAHSKGHSSKGQGRRQHRLQLLSARQLAHRSWAECSWWDKVVTVLHLVLRGERKPC